jgi:hypothetical protein
MGYYEDYAASKAERNKNLVTVVCEGDATAAEEQEEQLISACFSNIFCITYIR